LLGKPVGNAGGEGGGENIDQVVADKDRDQEFLWGVRPTVEAGARETTAALAKRLQACHRQGRECGLRCGKKPGSEQTEEDCDHLRDHCVYSRVRPLHIIVAGIVPEIYRSKKGRKGEREKRGKGEEGKRGKEYCASNHNLLFFPPLDGAILSLTDILGVSSHRTGG
jgi:hypothetical protein